MSLCFSHQRILDRNIPRLGAGDSEQFPEIQYDSVTSTEFTFLKHLRAMPNASRVYDRWIKDERITLLAEPAGLDRLFRRFSRSLRPSPKDWADSRVDATACRSKPYYFEPHCARVFPLVAKVVWSGARARSFCPKSIDSREKFGNMRGAGIHHK